MRGAEWFRYAVVTLDSIDTMDRNDVIFYAILSSGHACVRMRCLRHCCSCIMIISLSILPPSSTVQRTSPLSLVIGLVLAQRRKSDFAKSNQNGREQLHRQL